MHHGFVDIAGWEEMYRSGERGGEDAPTALITEWAPRVTPGMAIDLACGSGRNALYLAELGWDVTAIDGSESAIAELQQRAQTRRLGIQAQAADLTAPDFHLASDQYKFVLIAFYLQRSLFPLAKAAVSKDGLILCIAHIPDPGQEWSSKRARPGELHKAFSDWEILWDYEGPSRDPAHKRPVAEVVARRPGA